MNASTGAYDLMYERDMMPYGVNSAEEALSGVAPNARWAGSFFFDDCHTRPCWSLHTERHAPPLLTLVAVFAFSRSLSLSQLLRQSGQAPPLWC